MVFLNSPFKYLWFPGLLGAMIIFLAFVLGCK